MPPIPAATTSTPTGRPSAGSPPTSRATWRRSRPTSSAPTSPPITRSATRVGRSRFRGRSCRRLRPGERAHARLAVGCYADGRRGRARRITAAPCANGAPDPIRSRTPTATSRWRVAIVPRLPTADQALLRDLDPGDVLDLGVAPGASRVGPAELQRAAPGGVQQWGARGVVPGSAIDGLATVVAGDGSDARGGADERMDQLAQRPDLARLAVVGLLVPGVLGDPGERVGLPGCGSAVDGDSELERRCSDGRIVAIFVLALARAALRGHRARHRGRR